MTKRPGCSELSTPPSDAKAMFDAFEKWWSAEQFPDRPISLMARNAFYAGWETREVAQSESAPIDKVVAAFIAPDNQQWQGSTVNVTEDGSWWRWNGKAWERDTAPLTEAK